MRRSIQRQWQDRKIRSDAYKTELRALEEKGAILKFYLGDWSEPFFYHRSPFNPFRRHFQIPAVKVVERDPTHHYFFGFVYELNREFFYEVKEDPALGDFQHFHIRTEDFLHLFAKEWQLYQEIQAIGWISVRGGVYSQGTALNRYGDFLANPMLDQIALLDPSTYQLRVLTIQGIFITYIVGIYEGVWYLLKCNDLEDIRTTKRPPTLSPPSPEAPLFQYLRLLEQRHYYAIDTALSNMIYFITSNYQTPLRNAEYLLMRYWTNHFQLLDSWRESPKDELEYHVLRERYRYRCLETGEIVELRSEPKGGDDFLVETTIAGKPLTKCQGYVPIPEK